MASKRDQEGYYMLDHRGTPGIAAEVMVRQGLSPNAGRGLYESSTFTCADCQKVVINEPTRTRARGYCPKCDHYLCDTCESIRVMRGGECRNLKMRMDKWRNDYAKNPHIAPLLIFE